MLQDTLRRLIPGQDINVEAMNDNIILTGSVNSAQQARTATDVSRPIPAAERRRDQRGQRGLSHA